MPVEYNPMTGARRDLDVTKEDGAAAQKTHERWRQKRIGHLERLLLTCSEPARACYSRELVRLRNEVV